MGASARDAYLEGVHPGFAPVVLEAIGAGLVDAFVREAVARHEELKAAWPCRKAADSLLRHGDRQLRRYHR